MASAQTNKYWTRSTDLGLERSTASVESHVSAEIFAAECARIYRKQWLVVGREDDIPEPGSYFLKDVPTLKAQALVVRGKEGKIRAFYNSCSHRGVTLVTEKAGRAMTFRCPYHSWLYGADGSLRAIPARDQFPCVDEAKSGLTPIALSIWNGFIFLNFDPEPEQSLSEFLGGFGDLHATLPFARYASYIKSVSDFAANWKSGMHTFSEGYHITTAHSKTLSPQLINPQTNPIFQFYDIQTFGPHSTNTLERNYNWRPGTPVTKFAISQMTPPTAPREDEAAESGFASHPALNRVGIPNFGAETLTIFPNTCLQPMGGGYLWMTFWPLATDRTRVEVRLHSERSPASLREEFAAVYGFVSARDVLTEDFSLTEMQQRGFTMGAKTVQHFGDNEPLLRHFARAVDYYLYGGEPLPAHQSMDHRDAE